MINAAPMFKFPETRLLNPEAVHAGWMRVLAYLRSLSGPKPEHHTGHNPAGGWAIVLLLGLAILTGGDKWLEAQVLNLLPESWVRVTTLF